MHVKKILSPVEKIRKKFLACPKNTLIHQENQKKNSCPSKNTLARQENRNNISYIFFKQPLIGQENQNNIFCTSKKMPSPIKKIKTIFLAHQKKSILEKIKNRVMWHAIKSYTRLQFFFKSQRNYIVQLRHNHYPKYTECGWILRFWWMNDGWNCFSILTVAIDNFVGENVLCGLVVAHTQANPKAS